MKFFFTITIVVFLLQTVMAYITKMKGTACGWTYSLWQGNKGSQYTQTINFNAQFLNIPQVVLNLDTIENLIASRDAYGYIFSISEITTTYFVLSLSLDYNKQNHLCFSWFAFDDKRYEVIHKYNVDNPVTDTFPHNNKNARDGFITFLSFVATDTVDFTLSLNSITETTYKVSITQTNLLKLGYTVFLGPKDAQNITEIMADLPLPSDPRLCLNFTIVDNKYWRFFPVQFSFSATTSYNLQFPQYSTSSYEKYCLGTWSSGFFLKFGHQCDTIDFTYVFQSMKLKNIRISKMESLMQANSIKLSIQELNKNYETTIEDQLEASSSITSLTLTIIIVCQDNQKVVGQFLKSDSNPQMQTITRNFVGRQNQISIHSIFIQQQPQYQYFVLSITANQIVLKQNLYNQVIETKILLQIDIQQQ